MWELNKLDKRKQLQQLLTSQEVNVFTIMEANLDNTIKYHQYPGYTLYLLPKFRQVASGKRWKLDLPTIPGHPRNQAVATFRFSTGHDCLAKHLHWIGILQLPYCTLCKEQEDMDRTHILKCSVLRRSTEREWYWEARGLMSVYN